MYRVFVRIRSRPNARLWGQHKQATYRSSPVRLRLQKRWRLRHFTARNKSTSHHEPTLPPFRSSPLRLWMMESRTIGPKMEVSASTGAAHISFILLGVSFALSDMMHLRAVAVGAGLSMMVYNFFHPHGRTLWLPFRWNLLFVGINVIHILVILDRERRSKMLTSEEVELYLSVFQPLTMSRVEYMELLRQGEWIEFEKGDALTEQGKPNNMVYLIASGCARVQVGGVGVYDLAEGQFVGEMGMAFGLHLPDALNSAASVKTLKPTRAYAWPRGHLIDLLEANSEISKSFQAAISADLVRKALVNRPSSPGQHLAGGITGFHDRNKRVYISVLERVLKYGSTSSHERNILKRFRKLHCIDEEEHVQTLKEMGWTLEEFERGVKISSGEDKTPQKPTKQSKFFNRSKLSETKPGHMLNEEIQEMFTAM